MLAFGWTITQYRYTSSQGPQRRIPDRGHSWHPSVPSPKSCVLTDIHVFQPIPNDLVMLTETWRNKDTLNSELVMSGYEILWEDRVGLTNSSILVYFRSSLGYASVAKNAFSNSSVGWLYYWRPLRYPLTDSRGMPSTRALAGPRQETCRVLEHIGTRARNTNHKGTKN